MPYSILRFFLKVTLLFMLTACGGGGSISTSDGLNAGVASATDTASSKVANDSLDAGIPSAKVVLALQTVMTGLNSPIFLTAPVGDTRLFIVERGGKIRIVQNGVLLNTPFLDISGSTTTNGERGLLSMAFHPQYASNGFFFIYYTDINGNIAIDRFSLSPTDPSIADPLSGLRILSILHPNFSNHNGGLISFGPDGYLYIGTGDGDGGGSGDPLMNAQSTNSMLGKLLRIDVNASTLAQRYAIPTSNPFFSQSGRRAEIWAYGLRNPWRYAFDGVEHLLYIADVGQAKREEINVANVQQAELNYGWNSMEGTLCFLSDICNSQGLVLPVLEYGHDGGACSITGGYVYRGSAIPELQGRYFYADLCTGKLKSFIYQNDVAAEQTDWDIQNVAPIYSFGQDAQQELYLMSGKGSVYRIVRQ
jgi:glucose/arabinose dehydrogenase